VVAAAGGVRDRTSLNLLPAVLAVNRIATTTPYRSDLRLSGDTRLLLGEDAGSFPRRLSPDA
jgi:hypothetical protein